MIYVELSCTIVFEKYFCLTFLVILKGFLKEKKITSLFGGHYCGMTCVYWSYNKTSVCLKHILKIANWLFEVGSDHIHVDENDNIPLPQPSKNCYHSFKFHTMTFKLKPHTNDQFNDHIIFPIQNGIVITLLTFPLLTYP